MNRKRKLVISLLDKARGLLSQNDIENCDDLLAHNEFGIAAELILSKLHDYGSQISEDLEDTIYKVASEEIVGPAYVEPLISDSFNKIGVPKFDFSSVNFETPEQAVAGLRNIGISDPFIVRELRIRFDLDLNEAVNFVS